MHSSEVNVNHFHIPLVNHDDDVQILDGRTLMRWKPTLKRDHDRPELAQERINVCKQFHTLQERFEIQKVTNPLELIKDV